MNKRKYSPDMILTIIHMKRDKLSCTTIANHFTKKYGVEITKNAIIGKLDRMRKQGYKI